MFLVIHLSPPRWKVGAFLIAQLIKNPPAVYLGSIPGLGRFPGKEKGYPLQYSGLKNSMNCIVHRIAKSQTRLSDFHFHEGGEEKPEERGF